MSFDNPGVLPVLALLFPLILVAILHYRKGRPVLGLFLSSGPSVSPNTDTDREDSAGGSFRGNGREKLRLRYFCSVFFFLIFIASLIIALAEPHWGYRQVPEFRRGEDVVLAFDLSRSMDVRDAFSPEGSLSRFDRAVALARELADDMTRRTGEVRFAVAVGKGMGILALPLTDDAEAILGFLEGLSLSTVTGRGTNLESLMAAATGAFREDFPTWRRIILFSDGEGLSGSFAAAVEKAKKAEIRISAVGMGTVTGGPVPLDQGYLLGEDGLPVYSFLREEMLRNAAEDTGGVYLPGNREDAAVLLAEQIVLRSGEGMVPGFKTEPENRRHIFILLAIGALGMTKLSEKRRRNGTL